MMQQMNSLSGLESVLMRSAASVLSPSGRRGSLLVLIFHRVLSEPDPILPDEPDAAAFAAQMDLVGSLFQVMTLSEAAERLKTGSLPARAACITFDDGYANNREIAAPILARRGMTATFFVATGFLDGGRMWNDTIIECVRRAPETLDLSALGWGTYQLTDAASRRRAIDDLLNKLKYLELAERLQQVQLIAERAEVQLPSDLMMSQTQVRELASLGMEIGAHSVNHPILTRIDAAVAHREILESKQQLESIIGTRVRTFAYPNGRPQRDYDRNHVAMVRDAGFDAAVSTGWGKATRATDVYQIPRVAPWDRTARRYGLRMLTCYLQRPAAGA